MFRNLLYFVVIVLSLFSCNDDPIVGEVPPAETEDFSRIEAFLARDWTIESFFTKIRYISIPWKSQTDYVVYRSIITNKQDVLSNSLDQNVMTLSVDPSFKDKGLIEKYIWVTQEPVAYHLDSSSDDYAEMANFFVEQQMNKKIFRIREYLKIETDQIKNQVFLKTERRTIEEYTPYSLWQENNDIVLPAEITKDLICVKLPIEIGNTETSITRFESDSLLFKVKKK